MLMVLLPTVTGYYKDSQTVRDKKFAHDQQAAAAVTAKQSESAPLSQGGNPSS